MAGINPLYGIPKYGLTGTQKSKMLRVSKIADSTVRAYWLKTSSGTNVYQDPALYGGTGGTYHPPSTWPKAGRVLAIPKTWRVISSIGSVPPTIDYGSNDLSCTNGNSTAPQVFSSFHAFTSADIGRTLRIKAGTDPNWILGVYTILHLVGATGAILSSQCSTVGHPGVTSGVYEVPGEDGGIEQYVFAARSAASPILTAAHPNLIDAGGSGGPTHWLEGMVPIDFNADFLGVDSFTLFFSSKADISQFASAVAYEPTAKAHFRLAYPKFRRCTTNVYKYSGALLDAAQAYSPDALVAAMADVDFHLAGPFGPFVSDPSGLPSSGSVNTLRDFIVSEVENHFAL